MSSSSLNELDVTYEFSVGQVLYFGTITFLVLWYLFAYSFLCRINVSLVSLIRVRILMVRIYSFLIDVNIFGGNVKIIKTIIIE